MTRAISGPFRDLTRLVGISGRRARAASAGALWARAVDGEHGDLWPTGLPPRPLAGRGPREWLRRLARRLLPRRGGPAPPAGSGALTGALSACHAGLARDNLRAASGWFSPFWAGTPTPLAAITQQGLVWGLAVWRIESAGPRAWSPGVAPLLPGGPGTTAADCLALHLGIERLVGGLAARLGVAPGTGSPRRGGGLRARAFLSVLPALRLLDQRDRTRRWLEPLERLIAASPLTCLVYPDLAAGYVPMPPYAEPLFTPGTTGGLGSGWFELWISHLARSLLAGFLSPPASFEALQIAERDLKRARAAARKRAIQGMGLASDDRVESDPVVQAARDRVEAMKAALRKESLARLVLVSNFVSASEYFYLRFADMLVRQLSADAASEMKARQPKLKGFEAREVFFFPVGAAKENAICFRAFERALLGDGPQARDKAFRKALEQLRPGDARRVGVAGEAGVTAARSGAVRTRFESDPVALPFRFEAAGYAPKTILAEWIDSMMA